MGENSKIEWTTHTFNPWIGCQKVSPGCDHCYAEAMMDHRYRRVNWGPGEDRVRTSPENWRKPLQWAKAARKTGERPRVFCASLSDWLDNAVPERWRDELCELIEATPELDWLLLSKRIGNYRRLAPYPWRLGGAPENVWLGVTAEDQPNYDRRWPILSEIWAKVRFISYEPALGPLRIMPFNKPSWIICGGESGREARQMDPAWARALMAQCETMAVPFFFKQMTRKAPIPSDLLVRQFPSSSVGPCTAGG